MKGSYVNEKLCANLRRFTWRTEYHALRADPNGSDFLHNREEKNVTFVGRISMNIISVRDVKKCFTRTAGCISARRSISITSRRQSGVSSHQLSLFVNIIVQILLCIKQNIFRQAAIIDI